MKLPVQFGHALLTLGQWNSLVISRETRAAAPRDDIGIWVLLRNGH